MHNNSLQPRNVIKNEERNVDILVDQFLRFFYVAYAMTVCKSQGCTFHQSYTVHEWERYTDRLKYESHYICDVEFLLIGARNMLREPQYDAIIAKKRIREDRFDF